jgi:hypothetical protein
MFINWCKKQNFYTKTPNSDVSHVLLDGGRLSVPFDRLNDFHEKYIEAVKAGEKLFVVEQKTPNYNFFVDIDYKDTKALTIEEIQDICKVICDKVKRHKGGDCVISVAQPKKVGELVKTGVHLNWPGYVVNQASALALREHILVALSKAKGSTDWNEVIDSAVYGDIKRRTRGSGLRMPWSYKLAKHNPCNGRGCEECKNSGKVIQVSYLPLFIYRTGPLSMLQRIEHNPDLNILNMTTVRTNSEDYVTVEHPSVTVKEGSFTDAQIKDEIHDEEIRGMIESFVQKEMEGQSTAYITNIYKNKEVYFVSTNSKYCENLKNSHGSNHVWFIISGHTIAQKCFCRCETLRGRRDGFCKDFHGRKHTIPSKLVSKLYPKKDNIKKCPEIKKFEEKVVVNQMDAKPHLESFMRRCMKCPEDIRVVKITKQRSNFMVTTTSSHCEVIKSSHDGVTMCYLIKGGKITQNCPVCKKPPKGSVGIHELSGSVKGILYPPQKK